MAGKMTKSLSIGNCLVEVDRGNLDSESSDANDLHILVEDAVKIKISVNACGDSSASDMSFLIVNPKDVNSRSKSLLQEVLQMYMKELPAMNYAANTGKKSLFLERCVLNGKYCTLLLKSNMMEGSGERTVANTMNEKIKIFDRANKVVQMISNAYYQKRSMVVAAVTYQIIPADTQHVEIPLAAVSSTYQHKGIGQMLYLELRKRLQHVGIRTIFCWGDKDSEGFWIKQGFVPVAEVDTKGKARRLPIRSDIKKALCIPGGSTLLVSHIDKDNKVPGNPSERSKLCFLLNPPSKSPSSVPVHSQALAGSNEIACNETNSVLEVTENRDDADGKGSYLSKRGVKRRVWEASCSALKSKKVKGGLQIDCPRDSDCDKHDEENDSGFNNCSFSTSKDHFSMEACAKDSLQGPCLQMYEKGTGQVQIISNEEHAQGKILTKEESHRIMLMNIADDAKKAFLTKVVMDPDLGGAITSDGTLCTHIITGKARRTLNFCAALCSGAWIISAGWLKESYREGRFVGELPFILEDEDYTLKYRSGLRDAVLRAKSCPRALFKGYDFCFAKHVQPSADILSAIANSAGGKIICNSKKASEPSKTIYIACEEDMVEALSAAKRGTKTYSSDWFMCCIMRQELDLQAPQFAESL
ncbi:hypothetical protein Sjap_002237 [Stephania japonica]|uniref:BRCT domain-containing protein n=1 Tax=Stephania japonica TaxID=461633 RepID=A0AAP0KNR8_9MAGN